VLLLFSVTTAPPEGAIPLSVTVTVALLVLITLEGFTDTEVNRICGGSTVTDPVCVPP
jgi:hypothetical protein